MVTASEYFAGEGVTYTAESSNAEVAMVVVDGVEVTVTAVALGSATVTLTATNAGGSAGQSFAVTVQLPPVTLTLGGAAQAIELSEHFGDAVTGFDVSVSPRRHRPGLDVRIAADAHTACCWNVPRSRLR